MQINLRHFFFPIQIIRAASCKKFSVIKLPSNDLELTSQKVNLVVYLFQATTREAPFSIWLLWRPSSLNP